jgi:hypothetical protein
MKVYKIPEKFKCPRGKNIVEVKQINFYPGGLRAKEIFRDVLPIQHQDGWFAVDMVRNNQRIVLTLCRTEE